VIGQVTLAQPAGPGGVLVALATSDPAAAAPTPCVRVVESTISTFFHIRSFKVPALTEVTITASCVGGSASAILRVLPASGVPGLPAGARTSPPVYNPANGHYYYEVTTVVGLTWQQAAANAAATSYGGVPGFPGHLATVTSPEEREFVLTKVAKRAAEFWIGLLQNRNALDHQEPNGGWRWVTWEPYDWNDWRTGPNNARGEEDVVAMSAYGWNDLSASDQRFAYVVEFESSIISAPVPGNLLVNGSFEEPYVPPMDQFRLFREGLPGWSITRGSVEIYPAPGTQPAPDAGFQCLDLVGVNAGAIEQRFPTVPGQVYQFAGWISHNPDNQGVAPEGRANVLVNGQTLTWLHHRDGETRRGAMRWVRFAVPFRATGATTTLTISDETRTWDRGGLFLDGLSVTAVDTRSPAAPTDLTARAAAPTRVELAWVDHSTNETAFAVWRKGGAPTPSAPGTPTEGDWRRIAVLAPNSTNYVDRTVSVGTTYVYRVRATNNYGASAWSQAVTVTTRSSTPPPNQQ
jgi:hypothetical protein